MIEAEDVERTIALLVKDLRDAEAYMGAVEQMRCVGKALDRLAAEYECEGSYARADVIMNFSASLRRSDKYP